MDSVLSSKDPSPCAQPWSQPGRTGITLSFPRLKIGKSATPMAPPPPPSPPSMTAKPRKDSDPLMSSAVGPDPAAHPGDLSTRGDFLQKLLDGTATPAELRDAESSTTVPDDVLVAATEAYERQLRDNQSPPSQTVPEESDSLFGDDFFDTDPFWTIPNGCSTPNSSQILRGDPKPQTDLEESLPDQEISATTSSNIMQAALDSINDVSDAQLNQHTQDPDPLHSESRPIPDLTTSDSSKPAPTPQSGPSPALNGSAHKRRLMDTDSEDSLASSRPNEKSRRLSSDEDDEADDAMDVADSSPPPVLGPPKYKLPSAPSRASAPGHSSSRPLKDTSSTSLTASAASTLPAGTSPAPHGTSSAPMPSASGKGRLPQSKDKGKLPLKYASKSSKPSAADRDSAAPPGTGRRSGRDHRPRSRSPSPSSSRRQTSSTKPPPRSASRANRTSNPPRAGSSRSDPPPRAHRESGPSHSDPALNTASQPRELQIYKPDPNHSVTLDSSTFKYDIGRLINEARYGNGREVATAAGLLSTDDPLVKPAPPGSLFSAEEVLPPDQRILDDSLLVQVMDIPEQLGAQLVSLKTKGNIPFVLLAKRPTDRKWSLPPLDIYDDFMNLFQCALIQEDLPLFGILEWYNKRGNVGLFGLNSNDLALLVRLRLLITSKMMDGWIFNSYPHALAAKRYELTALLKANLRALDLKVLPAFVFLQNKNLALKGSLECVKYKIFKKHEVSQQGESKEHWRLVVLSADEAFMSAIKAYPQHQPFIIGTGSVQIRGGERRSDNSKKTKRSPSKTQRPHHQSSTPTTDSYRSRPQDRHRDPVPSRSSDRRDPPRPDNRRPRPRRTRSPSPPGDTGAEDMDTSDYPDLPPSRGPPSKSGVPVFANLDRGLVVQPTAAPGSVARYATSGSSTRSPRDLPPSKPAAASASSSSSTRKIKLIDRPLGDLQDRGSWPKEL